MLHIITSQNQDEGLTFSNEAQANPCDSNHPSHVSEWINWQTMPKKECLDKYHAADQWCWGQPSQDIVLPTQGA